MMTSKPIAAIFGATGRQGSAVAKYLAPSFTLRCVSRRPPFSFPVSSTTTVESVQCDLLNKQHVRHVIRDASLIFLVHPEIQSQDGLEQERSAVSHVIDCICEELQEKSGNSSVPPHVIYSSSIAAQEPAMHAEMKTKSFLEQYVIAKSQQLYTYTIVRPVFFASNFKLMAEDFKAKVMIQNAFMCYDESFAFDVIIEEDIGKLCAAIANSSLACHGKILEIASDRITPILLRDLLAKKWNLPLLEYKKSPVPTVTLQNNETIPMDLSMLNCKTNDLLTLVPKPQKFAEWVDKNL